MQKVPQTIRKDKPFMIVETSNLTKMYGNKVRCSEICLSVGGGGRLLVFLGPNGAGKSTLVKMLVGLLFHQRNGKNSRSPLGNLETRRKTGLAGKLSLSGLAYGRRIAFLSRFLYGLSAQDKKRRIPAVLEQVGRGGKGAKGGYLRQGMQRRLGLACALLPARS